ncbi:hypothetical protein [Corynebacterium suedekumii]|uniref:Uncharacterized protein n=1 Tax=Corynebacterium suedekumii TaxID=3049801 RepID=A0ABY8VRB6_9CORY|nr:hypothetical protein [Corynebacterium suedekumii]WIM70728.1 hypothetical protein QP029_02540 [Corynebacterium suedekumii]
MSGAGGPLVDIVTLSDGEQRKFRQGGNAVRLARGIYIPTDTWRTLDRRSRAVARIVAAGRTAPTLMVAGKSAAVIHGMPLPGYDDTHDIELAGCGATSGRRSTRGFRYRNIPPAHQLLVETVSTRFGPVHVSPPSMAGLDVARWHDLAAGVRCLDHALATGLTTREDIERVIQVGNRVTGVGTMREAGRLATPWSQSPRESDLKVALWRAGLPPPQQQVMLFDADGVFLARLDFFWPEIGFGVEYDGQGKFTGEFGVPVEVSARQDMERQHRIVNLGVLLFRVDRSTYLDGSAVAGIVGMHGRVAERGIPLAPAFWRGGGLAWTP